MMRFYHLKNCDTCKKARKALDAVEASYEPLDVREDGIREPDLIRILRTVGWEKAVNRRSTTWRQLSDADKDGLDTDSARDLIKAHPTLLKRPAIMDGKIVTVGWDAKAQAAWLGR